MRRPLKFGNERNPYPVLYFTGDCSGSAGEEGEDDVKSARPLHLGPQTSYTGADNGSRRRKPEPILKTAPQFRLRAAIRPHEVGIGSNRESAGRGEYVLGSCTHRPSRQQSWERMNHTYMA